MNLDSAVFYSNDIEKVIPLYRDVLGFKVDYEQKDRFVSFIFPNGARLGIKNKRDPREIPGGQTVFIAVDNVEALYGKLKENKFSILDADKNKILFVKRK